MIKHNSRFDAYAYRIGNFDVKKGIQVEEGQWVKLNAEGEIEIAGAGERGFLAVGAKRPGKDQVSGKAISKIAFLHGNFCVETDQVEGTVAPMEPLKVGADGKLTKATLPSDAGAVVAYALKQAGGFTKIVSA